MIVTLIALATLATSHAGFTPAETSAIEGSFRQFATTKQAHGGALVVTDGTNTITTTFGARNEKGDPFLATTPSRIASVSKALTATAVMKLIQDGKASLDDPVIPILNRERKRPLVPKDPAMDKITIRDLLRHTAGFTGDAKILWNQFVISEKYKTLLPVPPVSLTGVAFIDQNLGSPPGTTFQYSNTGYLVLGRIIEKLSGKSYEDYVWEVVLKPAGIAKEEAYVGHGKKLHDNESRYWDIVGRMGFSIYPEDNRKKVPFPNGAYTVETMDSYGGWVMSAKALVQFQLALPKILSPEMQQLMVARPPTARSSASYTGLGFVVLPESKGGFTIEHGGDLEGLNASIMYRANGQVIAVVFNTGGPANDNSWSHTYVNSVLCPILNQMD